MKNTEYIEKMAKQYGMSVENYVEVCKKQIEYEEINKTDEQRIKEKMKKSIERYKQYI